MLFAGGSFFHWFPLRGLTSEGAADWSLPARIADYVWHMVLPTIAHGGRRLRQPDHADQELLPRGDRQAIHGHRPRQGRQRKARAVRPRVPQRHAADRRRLPAGVHRHPVHLGAAGGDRVLARRAGPAGLPVGDPARLSGDVRHALHLHPARPADADRRRHAVHRRRSAHRFRGESGEALARHAPPAGDLPPAPARLRGRSGSSWCCSAPACSPSSSPTTGRC